MKKVYQTRFGKPKGNCILACIASVLEVELSEVPDILADNEKWWEIINNWAKPYGYILMPVEFKDYKDTPPCYCILGGKGENGIPHAVVGFGAECVHDPHEGWNGLKDDEISECTLFISIDPARQKIGTTTAIPDDVQGHHQMANNH